VDVGHQSAVMFVLGKHFNGHELSSLDRKPNPTGKSVSFLCGFGVKVLTMHRGPLTTETFLKTGYGF
jgi:hypothetical protein